jgi:transcriptional regulator with XRE-family HTH domain
MISSDSRLLRSKIVGAKIRQLRTQLRYSIKDTAELLGVSSSIFSSYETGDKAISLPELELLAYYFEVPLSVFLGPDESPPLDEKPLSPEHLIALRQRMIGASLRTRRSELDISLRQVGRQVDIPASRLSEYERGNKPIPLPELEVIVKRLEQSVSEYVDNHGPVSDKLDSMAEVEAFQALPQELRKFLVDPANLPYVRLAHKLSGLSVDDLRSLGEGMVQLSE